MLRSLHANAAAAAGAAAGTKRDRDGTPSSAAATASPSVLTVATLDDESSALVRRAYTEIKRREASLASNKKCSLVIELLLQSSSATQLLRFGESLVPYLGFLCNNRYSSHTLQTWLALVHAYLSGSSEVTVDDDEAAAGAEDDEGAGGLMTADDKAAEYLVSRDRDVASVAALTAALSRLVLTWLSHLSPSHILHPSIYNHAGTHVIRALIGLLSGVQTSSLRVGVPSWSASAGDDSATAAAAGAGSGSGAGKRGRHGTRNDGGDPGSSHASSSSGDQEASSMAPGAAAASAAAYFARLSATAASAEGDDDNGSSSVPAAFTEGLVRLVQSVCKLGTGADTTIRLTSAIGGVTVQPPASSSAGDGGESGEGAGQQQGEEDAGSSEELGAMACDTHASPTLQLLMESTRAAAAAGAAAGATRAACNYLVRRVINWGVVEGQTATSTPAAAVDDAATVDTGASSDHWLARLVAHPIGSRAVETIITTADPPLLNAMLLSFFYGRLIHLALQPASLFVVQRLLVSCPTVSATEQCLRELIPYIGMLYQRRREVLIHHIVAAAAGAGASGAAGAAAHGAIVFRGHGQPVSAAVQLELVHAIAACAVLGSTAVSAPLPPEEGADADAGSAAAKKDRAAEAERRSRVEKAALACLSKAGDGSSSSKLARWVLDVDGCRTAAVAAGGSGLGTTSTAAAPASSAGPVASPVGAFTLAAMLRFRAITTASTSSSAGAAAAAAAPARLVLDSLLAINSPPDCFARLCADPNVSRHVIEPLLELRDNDAATDGGDGGAAGASSSSSASSSVAGVLSPTFAWSHLKMLTLLKGRLSSLATTRFGPWVITKLFNALHPTDTRRRALIAEEIASIADAGAAASSGGAGAKGVASSGPSARALVKHLRLDHFKSNRAGWEASWARQAAMVSRKDGVVAELQAAMLTGGSSSNNASGNNAAGRSSAGAGSGTDAKKQKTAASSSATAAHKSKPAAAAAADNDDGDDEVDDVDRKQEKKAKKEKKEKKREGREAEAAASAAATSVGGAGSKRPSQAGVDHVAAAAMAAIEATGGSKTSGGANRPAAYNSNTSKGGVSHFMDVLGFGTSSGGGGGKHKKQKQ